MRLEPAHRHRAESLGLLAPQHLVQVCQHGARVDLVHGRGPDRVAGDPGHGRRLDPLAADVAYHDAPGSLANLEGVVEVAPHIGPGQAGRLVERGDLHAGDVGKPLGQEAALQRSGDMAAFLVQSRVDDGDRRPVGQILGQLQVGLPEAPPRFRRGERHRTERTAIGDERDDHRRAHVEGSGELEPLRVLDPLLERLVGDVLQELGATGPDDRPDAGVCRLVGWIPPPVLPGHRHFLRIHVGHRHGFDAAVGLDHLHAAPVGQAWDREPGDLRQGPSHVEGRGEDHAGLGQVRRALPGGLGLGPGAPLALQQPRTELLGSPSIRDVPDVAGEQPGAGEVDAGDRELDGELRTIGPETGKLHPLAQHAPLARPAKPLQGLPMSGPQVLWDDQLRELPADGLLTVDPEHLDGGRVHLHDRSVLPHRDDCLQGRLEDGRLPRLALGHGPFRKLALQELADLAADGGDRLQQGLIRFPDPRAEELDHPEDLVSTRDGKRERRVEAGLSSERPPREVVVEGHVGDP